MTFAYPWVLPVGAVLGTVWLVALIALGAALAIGIPMLV